MTFNTIIRAAIALHTGEVVGSIPTAPTIDISTFAFVDPADASPKKRGVEAFFTPSMGSKSHLQLQ
jgi:hypothetical protein